MIGALLSKPRMSDMSKSAERVGALTALWSLSVALVLTTVGALCGEEPNCKCQAEAAARVTGVPMLSQLPFVRKLFTVAPPVGQGPCCTEQVDHLILAPGTMPEEAKRFGIFFDAA